MVALLIIAMTATLSLRAVQVAGRLTKAAEETREANVLLKELLDDGPRTFQVTAGSTDRFSWTIETQTTGSERPVAVCRRLASVTNIDSAKVYASSTLEACPADDAG
jgi:hypothetical protein